MIFENNYCTVMNVIDTAMYVATCNHVFSEEGSYSLITLSKSMHGCSLKLPYSITVHSYSYLLF